MSITTKTGDDGSTGLMFNRRIRKTDLRVEAYGTMDELNAALGVARAASAADPAISGPILEIQQELVTLMGELAVLDEDRERYVEKGYKLATAEMGDKLTATISDLEKNHNISYGKWATPGETLAAGYLDMARTICRRAERRCLELREAGSYVSAHTLIYLNRLSDLCWLWARWAETKSAS